MPVQSTDSHNLRFRVSTGLEPVTSGVTGGSAPHAFARFVGGAAIFGLAVRAQKQDPLVVGLSSQAGGSCGALDRDGGGANCCYSRDELVMDYDDYIVAGPQHLWRSANHPGHAGHVTDGTCQLGGRGDGRRGPEGLSDAHRRGASGGHRVRSCLR